MTKNILEKSIEHKINEERYVVPKDKKKKNKFLFQLLLVIAVLLGVIISFVRLFI